MKSLVIYDTKTGNTPKIADSIAKTLKCRVKKVSQAKASELKQYSLIGFGSGIYAWRHSRELLDFAKSADLAGKFVFIFSTSGMGGKWMHSALRKILRKKKAWIAGEFACRGHDKFLPIKWMGLNKKRPNRKDVRNAKSFAKNLLKSKITAS